METQESVLVTGGMGFIGSYVVELLLEKGYLVHVVDRRGEGCLLFRHGVEYTNRAIHGDMFRYGQLRAYDHIVHLAAWSNVRESMTDPVRLYTDNVMATAVIADLALQTNPKSVVFASSSAVESPESHYGVSKAAGEMMMTVLDSQVEASVASLRFANVYGARQNPGNGTLIAKFIDCISTGNRPQIFGAGNQTRDYIYAGDVAKAIVTTLENRISGVMNVCTGIESKVNYIDNKIRRIARDMGLTLPEVEYVDAKPGDKESVTMMVPAKLLENGWTTSGFMNDTIMNQIMWQANMTGYWDDNHYIDGSLA